MISTFDQLKDWILYDSKPTTKIALDAFDEFCQAPSKELGRKYWCMTGGYNEVSWNSVFGIAPRKDHT